MLKNAVLSLLALLIAVICLEGALAVVGMFPPEPRLYPGDKPIGTYEHTDSLVGWKLRPGDRLEARPAHGDYAVTYAADEIGFRLVEDRSGANRSPGGRDASHVRAGPGAAPAEPVAAAAAPRRIVFLGDSFTFGVGVEAEETFAHLIGENLPETRSANFGMSGFGIDQMWLTLRHYASDPAPGIVVLSFVLDDLNRTMSAYRLRDTLANLRSQGKIGWVAKPAFELRDGRLVRLGPGDGPSGPLELIRRRSRIVEGLRRIENRLSFTRPLGQRWRLNREIFRQILADCERLGARLLVVYIPAKGLEERETPVFRSEFSEMGIAFLDLRERLPPGRDSLYFEHDRHFNPAGHRFAAGEITRTLADLGWVPQTGGSNRP